jgi:hypothetical protein
MIKKPLLTPMPKPNSLTNNLFTYDSVSISKCPHGGWIIHCTNSSGYGFIKRAFSTHTDVVDFIRHHSLNYEKCIEKEPENAATKSNLRYAKDRD